MRRKGFPWREERVGRIDERGFSWLRLDELVALAKRLL